MDATKMAKEIAISYADDIEMDERAKLAAMALVLVALEVSPTEAEWRDYLLISGLNYFDPEVEQVCIDATNQYYYSGLVVLSELEEDTWLSTSHPLSFLGVTDEKFAREVADIREKAALLREGFLSLDA